MVNKADSKRRRDRARDPGVQARAKSPSQWRNLRSRVETVPESAPAPSDLLPQAPQPQTSHVRSYKWKAPPPTPCAQPACVQPVPTEHWQSGLSVLPPGAPPASAHPAFQLWPVPALGAAPANVNTVFPWWPMPALGAPPVNANPAFQLLPPAAFPVARAPAPAAAPAFAQPVPKAPAPLIPSGFAWEAASAPACCIPPAPATTAPRAPASFEPGAATIRPMAIKSKPTQPSLYC